MLTADDDDDDRLSTLITSSSATPLSTAPRLDEHLDSGIHHPMWIHDSGTESQDVTSEPSAGSVSGQYSIQYPFVSFLGVSQSPLVLPTCFKKPLRASQLLRKRIDGVFSFHT